MFICMLELLPDTNISQTTLPLAYWVCLRYMPCCEDALSMRRPERSYQHTDKGRLLYAFLIRKKSIHPFTWRIFMPDFQRIRVWRLWFQSVHRHCGVFAVFLLISNGFPVWRLGISTLHKRSPRGVNALWMLSCPCEHFEFKAFTLETVGNQKKTSIVWMGEYFFGK